MHEFSLATALCEIVVEEATRYDAVRVQSVRCRVGVMRQVVPELMQTAFAACSVGTLAAGAALELEVEPVALHCAACGADAALDEIARTCPACGSDAVTLTGGDALIVAALEIDQEVPDEDRGLATGSGSQRCDRG
ncbi:MAG TPA: hydrogenase maturation nickel metallochaperone HypA [Phycisphaerae bacterium]|nr:hydrogenase maturation nickel metallochaperone HypA [Phycisphaerae bacterium]